MDNVPENIKMQEIRQFNNTDLPYEKGFAKKLGRDIKKVEKHSNMNLEDLFAATSE